MKKYYFLMSFLILSISANAQDNTLYGNKNTGSNITQNKSSDSFKSATEENSSSTSISDRQYTEKDKIIGNSFKSYGKGIGSQNYSGMGGNDSFGKDSSFSSGSTGSGSFGGTSSSSGMDSDTWDQTGMRDLTGKDYNDYNSDEERTNDVRSHEWEQSGAKDITGKDYNDYESDEERQKDLQEHEKDQYEENDSEESDSEEKEEEAKEDEDDKKGDSILGDQPDGMPPIPRPITTNTKSMHYNSKTIQNYEGYSKDKREIEKYNTK